MEQQLDLIMRGACVVGFVTVMMLLVVVLIYMVISTFRKDL